MDEISRLLGRLEQQDRTTARDFARLEALITNLSIDVQKVVLTVSTVTADHKLVVKHEAFYQRMVAYGILISALVSFVATNAWAWVTSHIK